MTARALIPSLVVSLLCGAVPTAASRQSPWPAGPIGQKGIGKPESSTPLAKPSDKPADKPTTPAVAPGVTDLPLRPGTRTTVQGCLTAPGPWDTSYKLVGRHTDLKTSSVVDRPIILTGRDDLKKYVNQELRISGTTLVTQVPVAQNKDGQTTASQIQLKVDSLEVVYPVCRQLVK